jgi:hypothetical protein
MLTIQRDLQNEAPLIELNPMEIQLVSGGDDAFPNWVIQSMRWITSLTPRSSGDPIDHQGGMRG